MTYKEWPACYEGCDACDQIRHRDDMVQANESDKERLLCIQCAGKQLAQAEDDLDAVAWEVRRAKVVGEWRNLLDAETNRIDGIGGTLWAALNAVTEWTDFSRSPGVRGDRRDHLKVLGSGAVAKRTAMRLALAAV